MSEIIVVVDEAPEGDLRSRIDRLGISPDELVRGLSESD
jgi:hypothetical protein